MMRVVDLFAGCGGMSLGFEQAGFNVIAAFDNWEPAVKTYEKNFCHPIHNLDLSTIDVALVKSHKPDIIIGGPPCQDFSSAGKRNETLGRADLTLSFATIIKQIRPEHFVMENVDLAKKSKAYQHAKHVLENTGYSVKEIVLNAAHCGVPQSRKRLFVFGDLQPREGNVLDFIQTHLAQKELTLREYYVETFEEQPSIDYYYRHPRSYARRAIFSVDEPSPTIRGVNRPVPSTYKLHSGDVVKNLVNVRPLTTKERAIIQTFPPNFEFIGNKSEIEQMLGNAVPVKMAEFIARGFLNYLDNTKVIPDYVRTQAQHSQPNLFN
jgi:DNA (cytosine-5)-methyltransferase 1